MARKWLNAADVSFDDATGGLLIALGATDIAALAAGIAAACLNRTPRLVSRPNPTVAANPNANGVRLADASTPYRTATVMAVKGGTNPYTPGAANAGTIYIATADSLAAAIPLVPGAAMELPPGCDLHAFFLIVANANDAVQIAYTT